MRWAVVVLVGLGLAITVAFGGCERSDKPGESTSETPTGAVDSKAKAPAEAPAGDGVEEDPAVADSPIPGKALPLGLDPYEAKIPDDNPLTEEKIALGKMLFFDPRLSQDNTVSCATCHDPQKGYSNGEAVATGVGSQKGGRASPTITNRLFSTLQFWDGRAASLEEQALGPIQNPIEMSMTMPMAIDRLKGIAGYPELFEKAFGTPEINDERIARAIASFERTVVSGNSPFDRLEMEGDANALSESQKRGLELFRGKAKCSVCHAGFNFTDEKYHNLGVGYDKESPDLGRYDVTKNDEERGAFKTPTLRDIALTAPYFHDGSAETLEEVVEVYDQGGTPNEHLSENMVKLDLTEQEKTDLVEFMKALTGDDRTVSEAPKLPGM
jgi:cytochrome c peroxidase